VPLKYEYGLTLYIYMDICIGLPRTGGRQSREGVSASQVMAATSFEHMGPQCLLTLGRSTRSPLDQFPVCVLVSPLYYKPSINTG